MNENEHVNEWMKRIENQKLKWIEIKKWMNEHKNGKWMN